MKSAVLAALLLASPLAARDPRALVIQTDFGQKDGAVAAMKGVAFGVSPALPIFDLSHQNTPYDIWQAAYRLKQTVPYWPSGTVFVSVVDPGVGTDRRSVVLKTRSGHLFVGPDNGTWTLVAEDLGVEGLRRIDETRHRLPGSDKSYTFHGRDIYAYVGARLASGQVSFDEVGPDLGASVIAIPYEKARRDGDALVGGIPALDFTYGNVWTNIPDTLFETLSPKPGERFRLVVSRAGTTVFDGVLPYARTFGEVPEGQPLLFLNSLLNLSFALNMGDFAARHGVASGGEWSVRIERAP